MTFKPMSWIAWAIFYTTLQHISFVSQIILGIQRNCKFWIYVFILWASDGDPKFLGHFWIRRGYWNFICCNRKCVVEDLLRKPLHISYQIVFTRNSKSFWRVGWEFFGWGKESQTCQGDDKLCDDHVGGLVPECHIAKIRFQTRERIHLMLNMGVGCKQNTTFIAPSKKYIRQAAEDTDSFAHRCDLMALKRFVAGNRDCLTERHMQSGRAPKQGSRKNRFHLRKFRLDCSDLINS